MEFDTTDQRHLDAADGWLGLGDYLSAQDELEQITLELRGHPAVLSRRVEIFAKAKQWEVSAKISDALVRLTPDDVHAWISRSFALHELKRTQEAYDLLLPARLEFPKCWTVPYNLACYCCQLGRLEEAEVWFKCAMVIDGGSVTRQAIDDPDLEPLWTRIDKF
jgi:tetratricopeptide (TPR) repeat protein